MGPNYNIHGTTDDLYYYCPNNDCACNGSSDHRGNDNYGTGNNNDYYEQYINSAFGDYKHYCCGYCGSFYNAYNDTNCWYCGGPSILSSAYYHYYKSLFPDTLDDLKYECSSDCYICSYDDPDYYNGAYRVAYNNYIAARGDRH
jgi:hypothetical protein